MHIAESELQKKVSNSSIKVGARYWHYKDKNKLYQVESIGVLEQNEEVCVCYRALYGEKLLWVRTLRNFTENVSVNGKAVKRFNRIQKIVVASENPVKLDTSGLGFAKMFPEELFEVSGVSAPSNVSNQPMTEEETLKGALNRAENVSKLSPDADYWVGIEGGLEEINGQMETFAWIVVKHKDGKIGKGKTGSFFLPQKIAELIKQGKELGEADDIVFGKTNSKQSNGAVGILTNDVLTRTTFYEPAVILALIPFKNPELY